MNWVNCRGLRHSFQVEWRSRARFDSEQSSRWPLDEWLWAIKNAYHMIRINIGQKWRVPFDHIKLGAKALTLGQEDHLALVRIASILINRGRVHSGHYLLGGQAVRFWIFLVDYKHTRAVVLKIITCFIDDDRLRGTARSICQWLFAKWWWWAGFIGRVWLIFLVLLLLPPSRSNSVFCLLFVNPANFFGCRIRFFCC